MQPSPRRQRALGHRETTLTARRSRRNPSTADRVHNVLFLCTANAARSILAEAILDELGKSRFRAYSAGSQPLGAINRYALNLLRNMGHDTAVLRSKSLDEFAGPGAPHMDLVFTVCDSAVNEACPVWPGHPTTAHWGVPDPKAATGTEAEIAVAFDEAYRMLRAGSSSCWRSRSDPSINSRSRKACGRSGGLIPPPALPPSRQPSEREGTA